MQYTDFVDGGGGTESLIAGTSVEPGSGSLLRGTRHYQTVPDVQRVGGHAKCSGI